jgi:hypothetical protein
MQKLFKDESEEPGESLSEYSGGLWATTVLGFLGSAVIFWIALRFLAPAIESLWGIVWINNLAVRLGIVTLASLASAAMLSKIEGTLWGKYFVIIGYLLSLGLIVWIALHLLRYV